MNLGHELLTKKSITLNMAKLKKVRKILKTSNDSETIRILVDKELMLQSALKANQTLRASGGSRPISWR